MSSTNQQTADASHDEPIRIGHDDSVISPTGTLYGVADIYEGAGGVTRVKLREAERMHNMYPSIHRLRRMIRDEDWRHTARSVIHER